MMFRAQGGYQVERALPRAFKPASERPLHPAHRQIQAVLLYL